MKYYNTVLDLGCFSKNDLDKYIDNDSTVKSLLARLIANQSIKRVKRNYYVVMDPLSQNPYYSKFTIASKMDSSNYIAYHSALEYYAYNNQVFYELTYCGENKTRDFVFENIEYRFILSKCDLQIHTNYDGSKVTSIERTIVDCIDRMDLSGGIEEIFRALDVIKYIDEKAILEVLDFYNKKILYQRVGYILSYFQESLSISHETLNYIHSKIDLSKCYLVSSKKKGDTFLDTTWNVCVPVFIDSILTKGNYSNDSI